MVRCSSSPAGGLGGATPRWQPAEGEGGAGGAAAAAAAAAGPAAHTSSRASAGAAEGMKAGEALEIEVEVDGVELLTVRHNDGHGV